MATNSTAQPLSGKWKGFFIHLGVYVIVISLLGLMNLLIDPGGYPWFLWPALGWGVGVAFHLFGLRLGEMSHISGKWRGFIAHAGSYAIIMAMLLGVYLLADPGGYPWFLWPALGWGVAVAIHFFVLIMGKNRNPAETPDLAEQSTEKRRKRKRDRLAEPESPEPPAVVSAAGPALKDQVKKARTYQAQIKSLLKASTRQNIHIRQDDLAKQIDEWVRAVEVLAERIESFRQNSLIQTDLAAVPQSIDDLERRLASETDESTRAELERTLTVYKNHLEALNQLQGTIKRAEIKIESTLSLLGTLYSQMLTSQSTNHVADYSRLFEDVEEEVHILQDHLDALGEVKSGRI
ncbi:MAG TPA: 2TM domain-containing protein [Anaerolineae bacterium]|nr:2TM domain-containing protein [Anaerolineae bacterium]